MQICNGDGELLRRMPCARSIEMRLCDVVCNFSSSVRSSSDKVMCSSKRTSSCAPGARLRQRLRYHRSAFRRKRLGVGLGGELGGIWGGLVPGSGSVGIGTGGGSTAKAGRIA